MMMKHVILGLVLLLAGCTASAQTRSATVDVNALLSKDPLYATLAQYDRQIAVLQSTLHTRFANSGAQIDNASAAMRHDLDAVAVKYRRVSESFSKRGSAANILGAGSSGAPGPGAIEANIRNAYASQHADLAGTAQRDMAQYRATLLAQQQAAYTTFVQSVNDRTQEAYNQRAQELREKESALLLNFARRDAPQRLIVRAKLQTLALSGAARQRLQARLAVLQKHENAAVAAMHRSNVAILSSYAAQLRARGASDIAKMTADLQARTNANLAARQRVLAAQTSTSGSLHLPSSKSRTGSAAQMQSQYDALINAPPADTTPMTSARDDLANRLRTLHDVDAANTQSVRSQIASLQHDREAVRKRMVAQIMIEAQRIAKSRGISQVNASTSTHPYPDTIDLTSAVASDLATLSP